MTAHDLPGASDEGKTAIKLTRLRLDSMPLPAVGENDDKEARGVVLTIGGSIHVPGAMRLAAEGAQRAGAGKLQVATVRQCAMALGVAIPEALIVSLATSHNGEVDAALSAKVLHKRITRADAVLIGPGMMNVANAVSLVRRIAPSLMPGTTLVLDGTAILALGADDTLLHGRDVHSIITPHAGEMASLLEIPVEDVRANASAVAQHCAERFQCVVVLKGGETWIAHPTAPLLCYRDGKAGLATSGSGDVLAGVVTGLAARGASPTIAAAWAVWAHGSAGNKLTRSVGKIGFIARELLPEIPSLLNS